MVILGVRLECLETSINFKPDPRKKDIWILSIEDALQTGVLRRRDAERLAGRLLFSRCSIFGVVGAAQLRRVYACARSGGTHRMGQHLRRTLEWWASVLRSGSFERDISVDREEMQPLLLYTDATGNGGLGYAMYDSEAKLRAWSSIRAPAGMKAPLRVAARRVTLGRDWR